MPDIVHKCCGHDGLATRQVTATGTVMSHHGLSRLLFLPVILSVLLILLMMPVPSSAAGKNEGVTAKTRCPVCGMFVAKYANWLVEISHADGAVLYFDGMKDALAYFFKPESYGSKKDNAIASFRAKDYYTLEWLDARKAFFVTGSDALGPMGHEFIPFAGREAADAFLKDHKGNAVLAFSGITEKLVEEMRTGQKMR